MATLKELEDALIKADALGNTDDAQVLADEIRKIRAKPSPTQLQTQPPTRQEKEKDLLKSLASVVPIATSFIAGLPGDLERAMTYIPGLRDRRNQILEDYGVDYSRFAPETIGKSESKKYILPGSAQLRGMMAQLVPKAEEIIDYQPTTAPGRYAQTIGTFAAPGILGKSQAARKFGTFLGAGGGGLFQGLQDVSGSPGVAAGITLPAMLAAGFLGGPSTAARLAQTSVKNVSKSDISLY